MKKLMTLMGLAALSFSAFALTTNKVGFETDESYAADETVASKIEIFGETENAHVWYGASDDASVVKTYTGAGVTPYNYTTYATTSLVSGGPGDQFLSVEAPSKPLVRSLANYTGDEPEAQALTGDVVADTLVQFTASEEMQSVSGADGTKFALWLYAGEGETNLYVTAGSYSVESDTESVVAANFKLNATVLPGEWHRVTIRAIKNIRNINSYYTGLGFVVYIDGDAAVCSDANYDSLMGTVLGTLSREAQILKYHKKLFLSLVNFSGSGDVADKLTGLGFKGTGYVDDLSIVDGNNVPDFVTPATGFVLSWDAGVVSFTIAGQNYVTENYADGYVVVEPTDGAVVVSSVTYDTAHGYGAGTWTCEDATLDETTFTLTAGAAEGKIVSSRATFTWNGKTYDVLSDVFADMEDAEPGDSLLIQLVADFNASAELIINDGFMGYDVPDGAVLDLKGQTITDDRGEQASDPLFYVGGDFTIIDSVGGGKLVTDAETPVEGLFECAKNSNLVIGQVEGDEGATVEGSVAGATLVRGFFTDTTDATINEETTDCSEEKNEDGYYVVAPITVVKYTFTVAEIANATATWTVDGVASAALTGLTNGTEVVVTYTADTNYRFTTATEGDAEKTYTIDGKDGTSAGQVVVERIPYAGTDYAPWAYSGSIVVWRATQNDFHASTVADVAADGTIGATYDLNTAGHPWNVFASTVNSQPNANYVYPGVTLVFDEAGYKASSDASFAPLSFGGLWVKALQADNTPYVITDTKTDGSNRVVELGATNAPCYFKFDESFTFNRNSATKVLGTATVEIASGKTFTINARANKGAVVDADSTLVLKGAGTLAVVGGLSVDGTLDLSAATRPSIDGDVALAGTIVLPANTEVSSESPFTVCTGTLSGLNVLVKIGDAEAVEKSFTAVNGAITAFADPIYVFTENYPTIVPAGQTYTFVGGNSAENTVVVNALDVKGTLKTQGYLSFTNYKSNGSTLDVESGSLTLSPGNNWFNGTLTVESGATFVNGMTDAVQYGGSFTANIYGTLTMNATRWSLGSNNTLNFYEGCTVTGSGDGGNGTFDWIENATSTLNVYGDVNLEAPIRIRSSATVNVNVDSGDQAGLTLADTIGSGTLVKKGAGLVKFTTNPAYAITVENGAFTFAVDATPTITYSAEPGTGTTMSMWYATQATWKGTVVIGDLNAPAALPLNAYGNENSKIVLTGTTGNCYLNGTTTVAAELVVGTNATNVVEFNNGSSGQVGTFNKVSGPGTLKLVGWGGCSAATYNIGTFNNFTGTLVVNNAINRQGGGTFTIGIGNIVTTGATTPTSKVLNLEQTDVENATGKVVYNTSNAQVNGTPTKLAVTVNGVYVASASASIGGVVTYYRGVQTAFTTVNSTGSYGDSVTILDGQDYGEFDGFEYNSETHTYTMVQMVAQFTSGVMTHKFSTVAAACADAEKLDPVPTVELLVELGEQTVPTGWVYNTPEASSTTYGTLTKSAAPSDTYEVSGETEIGEGGSFDVPAGTTTIKIGDYDVTDGFTIDGTTATLNAPVVEDGEVEKAVEIDDDNDEVTLNVDLVPGLYYGVGQATSLEGGINRPVTLQQFDGTNEGDILTVTKPEGDKGFFKVFVDIKE